LVEGVGTLMGANAETLADALLIVQGHVDPSAAAIDAHGFDYSAAPDPAREARTEGRNARGHENERAAVLNGFTALGTPVTEAVGCVRPGKREPRPPADLRNRAGKVGYFGIARTLRRHCTGLQDQAEGGSFFRRSLTEPDA